MSGKWFYIAISVALGMTTLFFQQHFFLIILIGVYILFLFFTQSAKLVGVCTLIICLSAVFAHVYDMDNRTSLTSETSFFTGVVHDIPIIDGNQLRFVFMTNGEKVQVSYLIKSQAEQEFLSHLQVGTYVNITGTLVNPSLSRNENQFNYRQFLYRQQIHHILESSELTISTNLSNQLYHSLLRIRQAHLRYIRAYFPDQVIPFMEALLFGERQQFSPRVEEAYQKLGIAHILAISGTHFSLLITGGYYLLLRLGFTKEKATLLLLFFIPTYSILAGASPSVIRGAIVGWVVLIGFFTAKKILAIDLLSGVFIAMLLFNPYYLVETGFQLSFITSFALIVSAKFFSTCSPMKIAVLVTVVAQLGSLPIVLYYFYEISPYGILLNLLFVPLITLLIFPLCILSLLTHFLFTPISVVPIFVLERLIVVSNEILFFFDRLPFATIIFGRPSFLWIFLFITVFIWLCISMERKQRRKIWLVGLVVLLIFQKIDTDLSIKVTFIDVGQGDSILIQLASAVYLIDTGGTITFPKEEWQRRRQEYDVGREVVANYLKSQGIGKIDKLIITHGHADHADGALAMLDEIQIGEIIVGEKTEFNSLELEVMEKAVNQGAKVTKVRAGDMWEEDNHRFYVLSPFGDEQDENGRSIVLYTAIGEYRWLFTGDLEEMGERRLLREYPHLEAEILKVGHHGSMTSTTDEFLAEVNPKVAIILVGENNRFNHPHPEVMERLEGREVLRTDKHGMITYRFLSGQGTFQVHIPYDE